MTHLARKPRERPLEERDLCEPSGILPPYFLLALLYWFFCLFRRLDLGLWGVFQGFARKTEARLLVVEAFFAQASRAASAMREIFAAQRFPASPPHRAHAILPAEGNPSCPGFHP